MNLTIQGVSKEDTAFDKRITFERDGVEYSVLLHWDAYDGYDLKFLGGRAFIPKPDWVTEWEESQQFGADSFEYFLDSLSEEALV
jgi:hypothetical protein